MIDSLAASSGFGLLMDKLADLRDSGMDIDTPVSYTHLVCAYRCYGRQLRSKHINRTAGHKDNQKVHRAHV